MSRWRDFWHGLTCHGWVYDAAWGVQRCTHNAHTRRVGAPASTDDSGSNRHGADQ